MKILIVSDTHGKDGNLEKVMEKVRPVDALIHCGDVEGRETYIEALAQCPVYMVSGNNDFFSDLPREQEIELGGYKILVTHGHMYGVSMTMEGVLDEARARGADVVAFGHTHKPVVYEKGGVTAVNPGSLAYPRQEGREPSYLIMEIDRKGQLHFTINYLQTKKNKEKSVDNWMAL